MKEIFLITLMAGGMIACGGTSEKKSEETMEQEAEMVETINTDLDKAKEELATEAEQSLNEIDSLLQNVE